MSNGILTGTYNSDLHKMVYLQNRRFLPEQSLLRHQKRGFPSEEKELQLPPAKRSYDEVRKQHYATEKALER